MERFPEPHDSLLQALGLAVVPPELIVIRGQSASVLEEWRRFVNAGFHPNRMSFAIPNSEDELPGFLAQRQPRGEVVAYVCQGTECRAPVGGLEELTAALASTA